MALKLEAVPFATVISPMAKPVTASLKVIVIPKPFVGEVARLLNETVGATGLEITVVLASVSFRSPSLT